MKVRQWTVVAASAAGLITLAVYASSRVERDAAERRARNRLGIVVLPFQSAGLPQGQEFANGMTEELTNRLAMVQGLRVIGRQSSKTYAGTTKSPRQIADELKVRYVLTGTIRWDKSPEGKDVIRVSPSLMDSSETMLWAESYQAGLPEIFEVHPRIATQVAEVLKVKLVAAEALALKGRTTTNREAFQLFVRGKDTFFATFQTPRVLEAARFFDRAVRADPRFASAWAYLAFSHLEHYWYNGDRTRERLKTSLDALDRAIEIDVNNPDVHLVRGIHHYQAARNYEAALRELSATRLLRPSDPDAPGYEAGINRRLGRWREALDAHDSSLDLDPRNALKILALASTYMFLGRYDEARPYLEEALMIAPGEALGPVYKAREAIAVRGNVPEAIEHLRNGSRTVVPSLLASRLFESPWPAVEDTLLANLMIRTTRGDIPAGWYYTGKAEVMSYSGSARARAYADSAVSVLSAMVKTAPDAAAAYEKLAIAHSLLGNRQEALAALAKADELLPEERDAWLFALRENSRIRILMRVSDFNAAIALIEKRLEIPGGVDRNSIRLDPLYAPLRADPRFQRLIYR